MFLGVFHKKSIFVKFHTIDPEKDEATSTHYLTISLTSGISLKILNLISKQLVNLNLCSSMNLESTIEEPVTFLQ